MVGVGFLGGGEVKFYFYFIRVCVVVVVSRLIIFSSFSLFFREMWVKGYLFYGVIGIR